VVISITRKCAVSRTITGVEASGGINLPKRWEFCFFLSSRDLRSLFLQDRRLRPFYKKVFSFKQASAGAGSPVCQIIYHGQKKIIREGLGRKRSRLLRISY